MESHAVYVMPDGWPWPNDKASVWNRSKRFYMLIFDFFRYFVMAKCAELQLLELACNKNMSLLGSTSCFECPLQSQPAHAVLTFCVLLIYNLLIIVKFQMGPSIVCIEREKISLFAKLLPCASFSVFQAEKNPNFKVSIFLIFVFNVIENVHCSVLVASFVNMLQAA